MDSHQSNFPQSRITIPEKRMVSPGRLSTQPRRQPRLFTSCIFLREKRGRLVKDYLVEFAAKHGVNFKGLQVDILRNEGHDLLKEGVGNG